MTANLQWQVPAWRADAEAWIRARLVEAGLRLEGSIEQRHIRPWSTVMRVPMDRGSLFFKATAPYLRHEAALTEYLARFRPGLFPELLAVDAERGWLLMHDAGTPLRQFVRAEKSFTRWAEVMPLFVNLQMDLMTRAMDLLELGLPDRRLERLPGQFEQLIGELSAAGPGHASSLGSEELSQLKDSLPEFRRSCELLASAGIPETLHHDDFHDGNIFVREGRILFTDWAESALAHPFFTLVVMLRGVGNSLEAFSETGVEAGPDTPEIVELRDLYLQHWTRYAPLADLQDLAYIAERKLGYVNRALTWHFVISNMAAELRAEYAPAVPAYLREYLNA